MVYRIYVEKKPALANEARSLLSDCRNLLGIDCQDAGSGLDHDHFIAGQAAEGERFVDRHFDRQHGALHILVAERRIEHQLEIRVAELVVAGRFRGHVVADSRNRSGTAASDSDHNCRGGGESDGCVLKHDFLLLDIRRNDLICPGRSSKLRRSFRVRFSGSHSSAISPDNNYFTM